MMTTHTLVACYDEAGAAEAARDDLVGAGIPGSDVRIHAAATPAGALAAEAFPEEDREVYAEAVRRGGSLVVARVPENLVERAVQLLERLDSVDLDERGDRWRAEGWTGAAPAGETVAPVEPALRYAPLPPAEDPARVGGFGDSLAYAAEPTGHGTLKRRVRGYRPTGS